MGLPQIAGYLSSTLANTTNLSLKSNYSIHGQQEDQISPS